MKFGLPLSLCLVAVVPQQAPLPPPPTVLTSAVLLGQVVDAETGNPVDDASVTLTGRPGAGARPWRRAGSRRQLLRSHDDDPRERRRRARRRRRQRAIRLPRSPGRDLHAFAPRRLATSPGRPASGGLAAPSTLEIREGQTSARVTIRLWKQAVLTGVVVDEAGEPVIAANVRAFRRAISRFGVLSYERIALGDDRRSRQVSLVRPRARRATSWSCRSRSQRAGRGRRCVHAGPVFRPDAGRRSGFARPRRRLADGSSRRPRRRVAAHVGERAVTGVRRRRVAGVSHSVLPVVASRRRTPRG